MTPILEGSCDINDSSGTEQGDLSCVPQLLQKETLYNMIDEDRTGFIKGHQTRDSMRRAQR